MATTMSSAVGPSRAARILGVTAGRPHPSIPALAATAATLIFIATTAWWMTSDTTVPQVDSATHMGIALNYLDGFRSGHPWLWFTSFDIYPPLVHLLGVVIGAIWGPNIRAMVVVQNAVFVPFLALGCYGAGVIVADDRRVGALAVIFALGSPMLMSQFHVFMLDAPTAAMAAVSLWLLLASRRFERHGYAVLAGVAVGLGMLTKSTFVTLVAGLIAVALLRGGWRNWRGILFFLAPVAVIAGPWYLEHLRDQWIFGHALAVSTTPFYPGLKDPPRFSIGGLTYYFWSAANIQLYAPLLAMTPRGSDSLGWEAGRTEEAHRRWRCQPLSSSAACSLATSRQC